MLVSMLELSQSLQALEVTRLSKSKIERILGLRVSGRTPNTDRVFKVGVARDHELPFNDGVWFYNLPLENEYKSFEVNFDEFYFAWHGKPQDDVPPPYGSILRKIRININDNNPEPFEADINIIQGI